MTWGRWCCPAVAGIVVGACCVLWACGADTRLSPASAQPPMLPEHCRSLSQTMPGFVDALRTGKLSGIRKVMLEDIVSTSDDSPESAGSHLLRVLFQALGAWAKAPPEPGAPVSDRCSPVAPAVSDANPLCEMRRALHKLVREGVGMRAMARVDPVLTAVFEDLSESAEARDAGQSTSTHASKLVPVLRSFCEQSAVCGLENGLEMTEAVLAYARTDEGKRAFDRVIALVEHPLLAEYFADTQNLYGGEEGVVSLMHIVLRTVQGMEDPSALDALPIDVMPVQLRPQLEVALSDLKSLLSPKRVPNILRPTQKVARCLALRDTNLETARMFVRLGQKKSSVFNVPQLLTLVRDLRDTDGRGTLLKTLEFLSQSLRSDADALSAAAGACRTLLSTDVGPGHAVSNAERALPEVATLFRAGVVAEGICAADALLYGCAGGVAPACEGVVVSH